MTSKTPIAFGHLQIRISHRTNEHRSKYGHGWSGTLDQVTAIEGYKKAAMQGVEPAKDALKRLG